MADTPSIPVLDMREDACAFAPQLGDSFRRFGFAMVRGHGLDPELVATGWRLSRDLFALPEEEKARFILPGSGGARGYTPFGTERAKGAATHDLKEFWHIGREETPGEALARPAMPANIWPERPERFRPVFSRLFAQMERIGAVLLSRIAMDLGLEPDWFDGPTKRGNSVLRLLHYPPVAGDAGGGERAGPHEDINLITLLLGAEEAGLELLDTNGRWLPVSPPDGALVVNIGDMLQRLTNHVLPSTTHRVRNPEGVAAARSRYAMPFFMHLRGDYPIRTLTRCISPANPDRYPEAILADDYLRERLGDIGLL